MTMPYPGAGGEEAGERAGEDRPTQPRHATLPVLNRCTLSWRLHGPLQSASCTKMGSAEHSPRSAEAAGNRSPSARFTATRRGPPRGFISQGMRGRPGIRSTRGAGARARTTTGAETHSPPPPHACLRTTSSQLSRAGTYTLRRHLPRARARRPRPPRPAAWSEHTTNCQRAAGRGGRQETRRRCGGPGHRSRQPRL